MDTTERALSMRCSFELSFAIVVARPLISIRERSYEQNRKSPSREHIAKICPL